MSALPREVTVRSTGSGYANEIRVRGHALAADEPAPAGGTDVGPDPYELLLASLGACTSMTVQMYARHKGWPLDGVTVRLTHQRVHARDCADCEQRTGFIDVIDKQVQVSGPLTDEQRARLLEIADRCPVHRTLAAGVTVRSSTPGEADHA